MTFVPETQCQHDLVQTLKSWTDGPKFVVVQSKHHYPAIKIADELSIQVCMGNDVDVIKWIESFESSIGSFYIVVDSPASKTDIVGQLQSLRPDLDIHRVWV